MTQAINQALRISAANIPESVQTTRVSQLLKAAEEKGNYNFNPRNANPADNTQNYLKAVAQVSNTYIVAEHPGECG